MSSELTPQEKRYRLIIDTYLATIGKKWEDITAHERSVLTSFASELDSRLQPELQTAKARLEGGIEQLEKCRRYYGAPVQRLIKRLKAQLNKVAPQVEESLEK